MAAALVIIIKPKMEKNYVQWATINICQMACLLLHENSCGASSLMYTVRPVLMLRVRPVLELRKGAKMARFLREFIITYIL